MPTTWTVGERVIWLSKAEYEESVVCADAEIIRMAHGQLLIRVLHQGSNHHPEQMVDRWVEPASLRKPAVLLKTQGVM